MLKSALSSISMLALASACSQREQAWIVVDMEMPDGEPAQMAFNNPAVPDMTLAECRSSLDEARPNLEAAVAANPGCAGIASNRSAA